MHNSKVNKMEKIKMATIKYREINKKRKNHYLFIFKTVLI